MSSLPLRRGVPFRSAPARILSVFLAACALPFLVRAQGNLPALAVPWSTVDGGGGTSTNAHYRVTGTFGQWDASTRRAAAPAGNVGDGPGLDGGFWPPLAESDPAPPEIALQPASPPPVAAGDCVTLFVDATGVPTPRFQWRRNGVRIPGATNPVLDLCLTNEFIAAKYDVLVFNPLGVVRSDPALVTLQLDPLPASPDFALRGVFTGLSGRAAGDNSAGKRVPGEPLHFGRRGGRTAWATYRAPATGILTLDTRGSSFDTLLAVYVGTDVTQLVPVAGDDDNGGFYRSRVRFRVVAGQDYQVAVDGRARDAGPFQLNWSLLVSDIVPPRFTRHPAPTTVHLGDRAVFTSTVENAGALQWYHDDVPVKDDGRVSGSRTARLQVDGVRLSDAGGYRLAAVTAGIEVEGAAATLHIDLAPSGTPLSGGAAFDKFADARDDAFPPAGSGNREGLPAGGRPGGLARGGPLLTRTSDFGGSPREPQICGVPGGASVWFYFQADTNGLVVLDTAGSSYDTVAGVFVDLTGDIDSLTAVDCNDDASAATTTSRVIFNANRDLSYAIEVLGKEDASGTLLAQVRPVAETRLTAGGLTAGGTFTVEASAEPGLVLVLEYTASLAAGWTPLQTNSVPSTGTTSYPLATGGADALYFRARPEYSEYPMISTTP